MRAAEIAPLLNASAQFDLLAASDGIPGTQDFAMTTES
jgi:hypothetical protein